MMIIENVTALAAFALCLSAFALGYALRNWIDGTRAEWDAFAYRGEGARNVRR